MDLVLLSLEKIKHKRTIPKDIQPSIDARYTEFITPHDAINSARGFPAKTAPTHPIDPVKPENKPIFFDGNMSVTIFNAHKKLHADPSPCKILLNCRR